MKRRPKTPEELRADLKIFEAAWKRERAQAMRNAVERILAAGERRIPAKYKMKLPRITRTVVEASANPGAPPRVTPEPSERHQLALHSPRKKQRAQTRREQAAETRELRRSLHNALKRAEVFRDGRPTPARYEVRFPVTLETQMFLDSAHSAHDRLLNQLKQGQKA
jgi:hypothetical protein